VFVAVEQQGMIAVEVTIRSFHLMLVKRWCDRLARRPSTGLGTSAAGTAGRSRRTVWGSERRTCR
jgi:membrane-associated protease RseP (regulator of RpoE activity)